MIRAQLPHARGLIAVVCLGLLLTAAASAQENLKLEQWLDFERVSDPQISPDGERIVYTRRWVDKVADKWQSSVWIMNADGSRNRFLLEGASPKWSPDGTRLAYLAQGEPKGQQLFVRWMDAEGGTTQVTRVEKAPRDFEWSPDGEQLAFVSPVPKTANWKIDMPKAPKGAKWTETPRIVERLTYRRDRQGFIEEGYSHIFVSPAGGGTPRQITTGDFNHGNSGLSWTPDGAEILFSALRVDDWEHQWRESNIWAVSVADKSMRRLTDRKGPDGSPRVSPDGKWVAYTGYDWTDDTYIDSKLSVMSIDGSANRVLTADLDRSPRGLRWAADSQSVTFNVSDSGTSNYYRASLDGEATKLTQGTHVLQISDVSADGRAVGVRTSPHEPGDIVSVDLGSDAITQLTAVNDDILADVGLGEVDEVWYDSVDGYRIQGWIVKPPGFDPAREYPMMLAIHGGPHGMYNVGFNFGWQEHAANG